MKALRKESGFSVVELFVIVVVLGVLGFVSYGVYNRLGDKKTADQTAVTTSESSKANDVAAAPEIKDTKDLDTALTTLDNTDPSASNSSDSAQLDSDLAAF